MRHAGAPMSPSGARWRWAMVASVVLALAAFLAWRRSAPRAPAAASSQPAPLPAERVSPPAAPRPQLAVPAIQLAKRVEIRPARDLAPGALEGTVLDAETNAGIAGAELTSSHDNGAWSTTTGRGGAFRFEPRAIGTYRLVSIEARGYASFEGEFGSSPVSFTSTEGSDISGVVLRLTPEDKARRRRRGRRSGSDQVDAGDIAPATRGSLRGRAESAGRAALARSRDRSGRPLHPRAGPARRDEPVRAEGGLPHAHRHARPASGRRRLSARRDRAHPARLRRRRQPRADRHRRRAGGATRVARGRRCRSRRRRHGCGPRAGRPDPRHRRHRGGTPRLRTRHRRDPRPGGDGGRAARPPRRARE